MKTGEAEGNKGLDSPFPTFCPIIEILRTCVNDALSSYQIKKMKIFCPPGRN